MFRCEEFNPDCQQTLYVWTPGQNQIILPPEVGLLWGTFESYFVLMQIHYNNPTKVPNQLDSTGVSIFYTYKLRQFDMGITPMGPTLNGINILPNTKNTTLSSTCPASCLNTIPEDGYYIIIHFFHAHKLGRRIRSVIKKPDGTLDSETFREDNYDFEHQNLMIDSPAYHIKRGYSIETTCEWDSTGMNTVTRAGLGTNEEMCLMYFFYYPKENGPYFCINYKDTNSTNTVSNDTVVNLSSEDGTGKDTCIMNTKTDRVQLIVIGSSSFLAYYLLLTIAFLLTIL